MRERERGNWEERGGADRERGRERKRANKKRKKEEKMKKGVGLFFRAGKNNKNTITEIDGAIWSGHKDRKRLARGGQNVFDGQAFSENRASEDWRENPGPGERSERKRGKGKVVLSRLLWPETILS